jgi:hypothetical protein
MNKNFSEKPYLLKCKQLEKTNNKTITRFVNDSLKLLWTDMGMERRVLLLLIDAVTYMMKAGNSLKIFYINMV